MAPRNRPRPPENIEALISAGTEEGLIEEEDRKLIQSVVEFGDKVVREVMTPRPNIVAISADATLEQLRQLVINEQYSRIPVYEQDIDQIIGFVHVRDMFELEEEERARPHGARAGAPHSLRARNQAGERPDAPDAAGEHPHGDRGGRVRQHRRPGHHGGPAGSDHRRDPRRARAAIPTCTEDGQGGYIVSGSFDLDRVADLFGRSTARRTSNPPPSAAW